MEKNLTYNLKLKMQSGQKVFCTEIGTGNDPYPTVSAIKEFGFDFIWLELEHDLLNKETIYSYICAAKDIGIPVVMRCEDKAAHFRSYLDNGLNGIVLPLVETVEDMAYAVSQAYYPPIGHRGISIGNNPRLTDFQSPDEVPILSLTEYVNNNTVLFTLTERLKCIRNLPQILRLEGVTGAIVGVLDLSFDIGDIHPKALMSEMITNETVERRIRKVAQICKDAGKVAGIGVAQPEVLANWAKAGYQLFQLGYVIDGNVNHLRPLIEEAKSLLS